MVFPCLPHLPPPPLFLTQEEGTCTEWTAHNRLLWSCTDHNRLAAFKHKKCSPQIFILLDNPCVIENEYSFTIAVEEDDFGSALRGGIVVIITSQSRAPARGESLCFSCCRQSISARGKHSTPLLLSAEEL